MSTSFVKKKRIVNERWESSQIKRNKATFKPAENRDDSESEEELVRTSSRGSKVRKNGIMIVEAKIRTERRPSSMDLIPACVPESVGFEIEDILQKNWQSEQNGKGYNLDPDYGIKTKKSSKARTPKKKSPRTMSTEDLPPNMLPEDYLDEVISQYFNDDCGKKISAARRESLKQLLSENSSNDEEEEEDEGDDQFMLSEEGRGEKPEARSKVKTDEELESEYKHIIFGAKKRKAPRLGFGSPKKKKKSSKDRERSEPRKNHEELSMKPIKSERSISPRKEREKIETKNRPEQIPVTPSKIDKLTTPRKETLEEKFEKIVNEKKKQLKLEIETIPSNSNILPKFQSMSIPIKLGDDHVQKWRGKKASRRAFDRSKLLMSGKKLYSFPKIEDVTGKYSKEEELVTCGICELLDPPVDPGNPQETTEWVGCDCYRWFHKSCTKLTKFTEKFSCKSVRMRCQEAPDTAAISEPVAAVLQVAILKFIRDRDITFIEDILW